MRVGKTVYDTQKLKLRTPTYCWFHINMASVYHTSMYYEAELNLKEDALRPALAYQKHRSLVTSAAQKENYKFVCFFCFFLKMAAFMTS